MPTPASLGDIIERNKQYGGTAYVALLEIDLPTGTVLRLAANPEDIEWPVGSGTVWQRFNFTFDDIDESTNAEARQLTFKVGNASRAIFRHVEELSLWRKQHGNEPVQLRLLVISTGAAETSGPVGEWFFEDQGISSPPPMEWVFFRAGGESYFTRQVPRRAVLRDFCGWESIDDCPFVPSCARTLSACRANGRLEQFGGFPMVEQGVVHG
ncbi:MAG: hypothetical protein CL942_05870 [Desulfovibrio sp.]|nr:hypothetical protein [Desulfovibrio sp.]|tara:strand:+ start:7524 stop:8156 length:633 start_codon:yes stop_codon:yes gene_type:complete